jgi:hypothetical protein
MTASATGCPPQRPEPGGQLAEGVAAGGAAADGPDPEPGDPGRGYGEAGRVDHDGDEGLAGQQQQAADPRAEDHHQALDSGE